MVKKKLLNKLKKVSLEIKQYELTLSGIDEEFSEELQARNGVFDDYTEKLSDDYNRTSDIIDKKKEYKKNLNKGLKALEKK